MGPAVQVLDRVGEGVDVLGIALVPLQSHLDALSILFVEDEDRLVVQRRLVPVQVAHERGDPSLVAELMTLLGPLILDLDVNPGIEKGQLAEALRKRVVIHLQHRKNRRVSLEGDFGAAPGRLARSYDRGDRNATAVRLMPDRSIAVDLQFEAFGEEVDDRNADPVETPGDLVGIVVELSACVQLGHDDLGRGTSLFLVHVHRDATAVVLNGYRAVRVNDHRDSVGVAGQRFVDGVVDNLVHHVVQAGDVIRIPDVHPGTLTDGVQALENFDVFGCVVLWHSVAFSRL